MSNIESLRAEVVKKAILWSSAKGNDVNGEQVNRERALRQACAAYTDALVESDLGAKE